MSIAEKLTAIAENEQKVYDAGKSKILKAFTNNYTRTNLGSAFLDTDFSNIVFEKTINVKSGTYIFQNYKGEIIPSNMDFANWGEANAQWLCRWASKLKVFPDMNIQIKTRYNGSWQGCKALETIEMIRCDENTDFDSTFAGCYALKYVTFEGVIGQNISFDASSHLTKETLLNNGGDGVFGKLKDYNGTGETRTITLHADTKALLTDAEKAIATQKGWTIA